MDDGGSRDLGVEKLIGRKDGKPIGWMIFINPERCNAVSLDMWRAILGAGGVRSRPRGAGGGARRRGRQGTCVRAADISQFEAERLDASAEERYSSASAAANIAMAGISKPTIAMIRGYCIGGGLAVALTLRSAHLHRGSGASPSRRARLGLGYGFGGIKALIDLVGPAIAKEILFTARQFSAEEALRVGLVNRVSPRDQPESLVREYTAMIGANAAGDHPRGQDGGPRGAARP